MSETPSLSTNNNEIKLFSDKEIAYAVCFAIMYIGKCHIVVVI